MSGEVIGFDTDIEHFNVSSNQRPEVQIDEQQARQTALARVPGAVDADMRIQLEYDDGRPEYSGTIIYQEMEYDFEIDAATGEITEWEAESVYDD